MRKWAVFPDPIIYNGTAIRKIMLYDTSQDGTYVFLYAGKNSQICCEDEWYPGLEEALSVWDHTPHADWVTICDPLPGCQEDAFDPVRIKGRDAEKPEWGSYEILRGDNWCEYTEKE